MQPKAIATFSKNVKTYFFEIAFPLLFLNPWQSLISPSSVPQQSLALVMAFTLIHVHDIMLNGILAQWKLYYSYKIPEDVGAIEVIIISLIAHATFEDTNTTRRML